MAVIYNATGGCGDCAIVLGSFYDYSVKNSLCYILFEMCCDVIVTGTAGALSFVCNCEINVHSNESQANFSTGDNKAY